MRRHIAIAAVSLALTGCTTTTPAGQSVIISGDRSLVASCKFIEQANGSHHLMGGMLAGAARQDAVNQLRARAVATGATHIITQSESTGWAGSEVTGDLYRCT